MLSWLGFDIKLMLTSSKRLHFNIINVLILSNFVLLVSTRVSIISFAFLGIRFFSVFLVVDTRSFNFSLLSETFIVF